MEASSTPAPPSPGEVREPELQDYIRQWEAIKRDASELVAGLDREQLTWRPQPGRWSIAECLDHLNSVGTMYLPYISEKIAEARSTGKVGSGPFHYGFLSSRFVRSLEPPVKMKVPMQKGMKSPDVRDPSMLLPEFIRIADASIKVVASADGVDLASMKFKSLLSRLLRLSLGQWFAFLAAHARRHLWQAWNVRNDPAFPRT